MQNALSYVIMLNVTLCIHRTEMTFKINPHQFGARKKKLMSETAFKCAECSIFFFIFISNTQLIQEREKKGYNIHFIWCCVKAKL